jgi:uncharacterized C2H2 Zn-finger protein
MNIKTKKDNKKKANKKIAFHLDDKGRRIFDFSQIQLEKREQIKNRKEKLKQNLVFETATFRCEKCQLTFTDNISYQEHLNGKSHNSKVHLQVKEATVESIKEKLLEKKRERDIQKLKEKE